MAIAISDARAWDPLLSLGEQPYGDQLVHRGYEAAVGARMAPLPEDIDPRIASALIAQGIAELYTHQAETYALARAGRHVCVVTGTASGKSLAYTLPLVQELLETRGARSLYLSPTKALAQDQARRLSELRLGLRPTLYDGDTPRERRPLARKWGNPILTNPDMLHLGILPNHERWADVLRSLTHVVVDEAHVYRGVFGSHVALVLRRLRRVCALYGANPTFLLASATVANPAELARALTGLEVSVVSEDGAPRAPRTVAFWQPPLLDDETGERGSTLAEAAVLLSTLVTAGLRTICFIRSRRAVEIVFRIARETLQSAARPDLAERLAPYRAGYTAEERRAIERDLVSGALLGVAATDALELGIDVGLLDCSIAVGFPGTVASLRQQWGRAGRRGEGLALYVPSADGLDRFFARHPEALLRRAVEAAVLDPESPQIRVGHLRAAAHELPITPNDDGVLGAGAYDAAVELERAGELVRTPGGLAWRAGDSPAARVSLRSASPDAILIVDESTGTILGAADAARALWTLHEGAVYLHRGESHLVRRLDLDERVALVTPHELPWYTQPRRDTATTILSRELLEQRAGVKLSYGEVEVIDHVVAYQRRSLPEHRALDLVPLDLPEVRFSTAALWFEPSDELFEEAGGDLLGTLHAAEHALISVLPLYAMCDRWDLGGLSTNIHPQTGRPTLFVHEGHAGGVGLVRRGVARFEDLVADTARLIGECTCESGCPSCVQSPKCGNLNDTLDKVGAARLLQAMVRASRPNEG
ncbi:MAG: box helicase protein [Gaiellales bacterium]|nr:box helicase protein [Gaiellales bacterium]